MDNSQKTGIGLVIALAVTLIVGAVFLQASAQNIGQVRNTETLANESLATVVNGTAQYITTHKAISDVVIYNETNNVIVGAGNYTITNNVVNNGALAIEILPDATAGYKSAWQVSGTVEPLTYENSSGGRSVAYLIIILMALALVAVGAGYGLKGYAS